MNFDGAKGVNFRREARFLATRTHAAANTLMTQVGNLKVKRNINVSPSKKIMYAYKHLQTPNYMYAWGHVCTLSLFMISEMMKGTQ